MILHPPTSTLTPNPSPSSSRVSRSTRTHKLKKPSTSSPAKRGHSRQQSTTRTPSVHSTSSSLEGAKHVFSTWLGNLRAGVAGAWTKARGEYETYVATQEGEARMRQKREDTLTLSETGERQVPVVKEAGGPSAAGETETRRTSSSTSVKRPASSDGTALPALKKRSLNSKKLKKQKSLGKLPFRKSSISKPTPAPTAASTPASPKRASAATPVYRATTTATALSDFPAMDDVNEDGGLRYRVQSLESELSSLRAKLRWFEQSYGEIPPNTLADISLSPRKQRKSVFKEELGSLKTRGVDDSHILPSDVRALKGTAIDPILEESPSPNAVLEYAPAETTAAAESTIKMIPPSPSLRSLPLSPPRRSPTKAVSSPGQEEISLLETLSPIHPNIIPALVPRQSVPEMSGGENIVEKMHHLAE